MTSIAVTDLRAVPTLTDLPEDEIQWMMENGRVQEFDQDEYVFRSGEPADYMWIVLQGKFQLFINQNDDFVPVYTVAAGTISGLLPYSRMTHFKASAIALEKSVVVTIHRNQFPAMERVCPDLVRRLVELMTTRTRDFTQAQEQRNKFLSLSKLSAGLAHELNNPASAITRSAVELRQRIHSFPDVYADVCKLPTDQMQKINRLLQTKTQEPPIELSAIQRSEREDEIADWLDDHRVADSWQATEMLVKAGITVSDLENTLAPVPEALLPAVIRWMDNQLTATFVLDEIETASSRISQLVDTMKVYTHMDQANDSQSVDIHAGIASTLAVMAHRLREANVHVRTQFGTDIPQLHGYVTELNQMWTNLIDNAIDAMPSGGELTLATRREGNFVLVDVLDTGVGIAPGTESKIFDPFFTTKGIGKGTGLGLDIVNRIAVNHNAVIRVDSVPGRTQFTVCFSIGNDD